MRTEYFVITEDKPLIFAPGAYCSARRWHRDKLGKDDARGRITHSLPFIFYSSALRPIEQWRHALLIDKTGGVKIVGTPSPPSITAQRSQL